MQIRSISNKIFTAAPKNSESNCNHTNPFGVNFKGNMITADVFETNNNSKVSFTGRDILAKAANRGKMLTSAIVGSIGSMNSAISTRLNSIVSFGREMKANVTNAWRLANNIEVNVPEIVSNLKERISSVRAYSVNRLAQRPIEDLSGIFEDELAIRALGV